MAFKQVLDFTRGFAFFFKGLKTAFSSWPMATRAVMPLLVNVIIFAAFLISFNTSVYYITSWAFEHTSQAWYWAMITYIAGALFFVVSLTVVIFLFVAVGLIIASPFNDLLSIAVERSKAGVLEEDDKPFAAKALLIIKSESKKMVVFIGIQIGLALMNFIPVAGPIMFVIINPVFIAFVMAFEFTSYTLDRRGWDFTAKRKHIFAYPGLHFGFGAAAGLTFLVPIVHFILLPAAVSGGTLLALDTLPPKETNPAEEPPGPAALPAPQTDDASKPPPALPDPEEETGQRPA